MLAFYEEISATKQHASAGFPGRKPDCRFYFSGNNGGFGLKRAYSATSCGDTSFVTPVFLLSIYIEWRALTIRKTVVSRSGRKKDGVVPHLPFWRYWYTWRRISGPTPTCEHHTIASSPLKNYQFSKIRVKVQMLRCYRMICKIIISLESLNLSLFIDKRIASIRTNSRQAFFSNFFSFTD